ncbi:MAG: hypothetical protein WCN89_03145, partial [bacterium]
MAKIGKISGFPEWLPEQKIAEDRVISTIRAIYESFGFTPIETPAVELISTLGSKGIIDKEIFAVKRLKADESDDDMPLQSLMKLSLAPGASSPLVTKRAPDGYNPPAK